MYLLFSTYIICSFISFIQFISFSLFISLLYLYHLSKLSPLLHYLIGSIYLLAPISLFNSIIMCHWSHQPNVSPCLHIWCCQHHSHSFHWSPWSSMTCDATTDYFDSIFENLYLIAILLTLTLIIFLFPIIYTLWWTVNIGLQLCIFLNAKYSISILITRLCKLLTKMKSSSSSSSTSSSLSWPPSSSSSSSSS